MLITNIVKHHWALEMIAIYYYYYHYYYYCIIFMCNGTTAQPGSCTVLVVLCLAHGGDNALHMEVTIELDHSQTKIKHFTVASSVMIILKVMP